MNKLTGLTLLLLINSASSYAQNMGNYGEVFPIIEQDIRQVIMNKLHRMELTGELERHKERLIARVEEHVTRPKPVKIPTTNSPESYEVDPSIVVNQNMYTHDGSLIAKAGMHLNPFDRISFSKTLFFFNADDPEQMVWVNTHYKQFDHVKFILIGGNVKEASDTLGPVYFDLEGRLSSYFKIKHVPAVIRQKGHVWSVQEIGHMDY